MQAQDVHNVKWHRGLLKRLTIYATHEAMSLSLIFADVPCRI